MICVKYVGLKKKLKVKVEFLIGINIVGLILIWILICFIKCYVFGIIKENIEMSLMSLIVLLFYCNCSNVFL